MSSAKKLPQFIAGMCVCIGAAGTGSVIAWTSNIANKISQPKSDGPTPGPGETTTTAAPREGLNGMLFDEEQMSWIASIMCLGACLMCFPIGWIADLIGRKLTCLITVFPFTAGWALITFAQNVPMVYIGRFLCGVAGGSFCILAPLYTCEMSETSIRGTLGTFFQLFITIGILIANIGGFICSVLLFNIICMSIPIIFGVVFLFQPETPVYDLKKDKKESAEKSFKRLRGKDYDYSEEMNAMLKQIEEDKNMKSFKDVIKTKPAIMSSLICCFLMFFQQFTGINAVMFFAQDIFTDSGITLSPGVCTIIIGAVQVVATLVATWAVEKLGRKILCLISLGLMGVATVMLGIYFTFLARGHKSIAETLNILPLLALIIFIIAFSLGMGPIPWLASSELFPPEIKAKCSSVAGMLNWFLAFLVGRGFKPAVTALGPDVPFYFFCAVCIAGVVFVFFLMPETKGKSFQEIQQELGG